MFVGFERIFRGYCQTICIRVHLIGELLIILFLALSIVRLHSMVERSEPRLMFPSRKTKGVEGKGHNRWTKRLALPHRPEARFANLILMDPAVQRTPPF